MSLTGDQMELREEDIRQHYAAAEALLEGFDHAPGWPGKAPRRRPRRARNGPPASGCRAAASALPRPASRRAAPGPPGAFTCSTPSPPVTATTR